MSANQRKQLRKGAALIRQMAATLKSWDEFGDLTEDLKLARKRAGEMGKASREPVEDKLWRPLALQFDRHRMEAIAWLKLLVADPLYATQVQQFLALPPLSPTDIVKELEILKYDMKVANSVINAQKKALTELTQCGQAAAEMLADHCPNSTTGNELARLTGLKS